LKFQAVAEKTAKDARGLLYFAAPGRPGLVALYDIRPGNGVGLFLQPRSLHGAQHGGTYLGIDCMLPKASEELWVLAAKHELTANNKYNR